MNQHEKKEAHKFAQVLRSARKSKDISQVDLSRAIGISQGQLSKLEKGINVPSAPIWFRVCEALDIQAESGTFGYVDKLRDLSFSTSESQGSFKVPKRYSFLQGSMARTSRPFLSYLVKNAGAKKADEFIRSKKLDPDYFVVLDHPLNFNFNLDLINHLISSGMLKSKNIPELVGMINSSNMHGFLEKDYRKVHDARDLLQVLEKNIKKYSANWNYAFDFGRKNTVQIVSTPSDYLKEFEFDEKVLGGFLFEYTKQLLSNFLLVHKVGVDSVVGKYEGSLKCTYQIPLAS